MRALALCLPFRHLCQNASTTVTFPAGHQADVAFNASTVRKLSFNNALCGRGTCEMMPAMVLNLLNQDTPAYESIPKAKPKLAGPNAAPSARKPMEFKIGQSSTMQCEKYKIPLHQHPMFTCSSLHNPIVKAVPDGVFLQRCFPSVGWSPVFPWSVSACESMSSFFPI